MAETKKLGVHGLIQNPSGKYLVIKRSKTDYYDPDTWDLPGGGIEEGEGVQIGFAREALEEAGMKVVGVKITHAYTLNDRSLQLAVSAHTEDGEIILSPEHQDYKWMDYSEFISLTEVSLHLKAVQYMLKNNVELAKYEDYK
jgi:8-oxo-dGTP pyrophosphatase MutT (NUDIX family)